MSRKASTAYCASSRTGFDKAVGEIKYTFQSIATRGVDGLVTDTNVQTIGHIHACFGSTTDVSLMTFYGEGALGAATFTGRGECRYAKRDYPEQGLLVMRCFLDLSDISGGRIGGQLTTNSMNSRNNLGDKTDPLGYTQSSIATIRWWKPARAQSLPTITSEQIKAMLVRPAGWSAYWSRCADGNTGVSDLLFETRGEKVLVKIHTPHFNSRCELEVSIASDVVNLSGCRDPAVTIRFDPSDHEYPFKGGGRNCSEWKVKAK